MIAYNSKLYLNITVILLWAGLIFLQGCGSNKDVLAIVNKTVITNKDFEERIASLPKRYQEIVNSDKKKFLDEIIVDEILYQEAVKNKIDKDPEVKNVIEQAKKKIIVAKYLKEKVDDSATVDDEEIKQYYNSHLDEFRTPEIFRASHILAETEGQAKEILKDFEEGANFEELARLKSIDQTAEKGGDLGYFARGQLYPEFEKAVSGLKKNELSNVFKTRFGYHIVKVTDVKPADIEKFEDVKNRIKETMLKSRRRARFNEMIERLKGSSRIVINEKMLEPIGETNDE